MVASKYCITDHSEFKMFKGEVVHLKKIHKNPSPKHPGFWLVLYYLEHINVFRNLQKAVEKVQETLSTVFRVTTLEGSGLRYNTTGYVLLHKAQADWHYLIIAELRPMYDSIPINLWTGSQAELGKKESRWAKRAERGLGERK